MTTVLHCHPTAIPLFSDRSAPARLNPDPNPLSYPSLHRLVDARLLALRSVYLGRAEELEQSLSIEFQHIDEELEREKRQLLAQQEAQILQVFKVCILDPTACTVPSSAPNLQFPNPKKPVTPTLVLGHMSSV